MWSRFPRWLSRSLAHQQEGMLSTLQSRLLHSKTETRSRKQHGRERGSAIQTTQGTHDTPGGVYRASFPQTNDIFIWAVYISILWECANPDHQLQLGPTDNSPNRIGYDWKSVAKESIQKRGGYCRRTHARGARSRRR